MGKLTQISIYPIKSCAGIDLDQAHVQDRGFPFDRRWLLIEEDGIFLSQRNTPRLGQIVSAISDDQLQISYPGLEPLILNLNQVYSEQIEATIWNDTVLSRKVSSRADDWFSALLGRPVHLVYMDSETSRPLEKDRLPQDRSFEVSFADGYPYLLANQASLDDLNSRLDAPIPMNRFRPNLVVEGYGAFDEDNWKRIRIGEVDFLVVKPCARCQVTTIDQKTGIASKEPLKTLASYRKQGGNVMFGMNLVAVSGGKVETGATVEIIE